MATKNLFTLLLVLAIGTVFAQTRRIAHRAHSGTATERYAKGEGNYGYFPQTVTIHLESGRDTTVYEWDSLARPHYLDTAPRANFRPIDTRPKEDIREMGKITGRMTM